MIRPCLAGCSSRALRRLWRHKLARSTDSIRRKSDGHSSGVGLNPKGSRRRLLRAVASGASGASAPVAAMPARGPTAVDGGGEPDGPMDAGDRVLDAGMPGALPDAAMRELRFRARRTPRLLKAQRDFRWGDSVDMDGPFETTLDESAGPERAGLVVRRAMLAGRPQTPRFSSGAWAWNAGAVLLDVHSAASRRMASSSTRRSRQRQMAARCWRRSPG